MIQYVFPTISGFAPYKAKVSTPYFKVLISDTPYTVKSHGPDTYFYVFDSFSSNPNFSSDNMVWKSNVPLLKLYSGKNFPFEISQYTNSKEQFGIVYSGYFDYNSASATFYFKGTGYARFFINGDDTGTINLRMTNSQIFSTRITGLTGNIHATICYWSTSRFSESENIFCVTWKDSVNNLEIPLAAGNFINSNDFLLGVATFNVEYILNTSLDIGRNRVGKFEFEIPIVSSTASVGYKYDNVNHCFVDVSNASNKIKKFTMVEYFAGYKYDDDSIATITKFVGQINDWKIDDSRDKISIAKIECNDWMSFLTSFNEGYPDPSDYAEAGYLDPQNVDMVAGVTRPRAYDGWALSKAIRNLLINGNIDPKIILGKRKYINVDGGITTANYLLFDDNLSEHPIRLEQSFNYGQPAAIAGENADDKYNWQFSIGDTLFDNLQKLMENYGLSYGFNNYGYFFANSLKNPIKLKSIDDMTFTGSWSESLKYNKVFGVSKYSTSINDTVVATFRGSYAKVIFSVNSVSGTVYLKLSNPTVGRVATGTFRLNNNNEWYYFDGVDDSVGNNPCIVGIGNGLKYGYYSLTMTVINPTIDVNCLFIYDKDDTYPVDTFRTGDYLTDNGVIVDKISVNSGVSNIRNDVIVVGKLRGFKSSLAVTDETSNITNPNNPIADHVMSRAIDRISVGSMSNSNYVGRKISTIIIEPSILTNQKADWLSVETLKRYNEFNKSITCEVPIVGHPLIEVGDKVKLHDVHLGLVSTTYNFYVNNINETRTDNGYITKLNLESLEPWESYYNYPVASLKRLNNDIFYNPRVYNTGLPIRMNAWSVVLNAGYTGNSTIDLKAMFYSTKMPTPSLWIYDYIIPPQGYIKTGGEIIKYTKRTITYGHYTYYDNGKIQNIKDTIIQLTGLTRGMYGTSTLSYGTPSYTAALGRVVRMGTNPYISEDFGLAPAIKFGLFRPGWVRVSVIDQSNNVVDILSGSGKPGSYEGWENLNRGEYAYVWGMIDRIGAHNEQVCGRYEYSGHIQKEKSYDTTQKGDWVDEYKYGRHYSYRIGQGFYAQNDKESFEGVFKFKVEYTDILSNSFKGTRTLQNANVLPIYTNLYPDGPESNPPYRTEEMFVPDSTSNICWSDCCTLWYASKSINGYYRDTNGYIRSAHSACGGSRWRTFYTGNENGGKGIKLTIKNKYNLTRFVKFEIQRIINTFLYLEYDLNLNTGYRLYKVINNKDHMVETVYNDTGFMEVNHTDGISFYLPRTKCPFITDAIKNSIDVDLEWFSESSDRAFRQMAVAHHHIFRIFCTDYSGRTYILQRSLWWVAPEFLNTKADWEAYIAGTKTEAEMSKGYPGAINEMFVFNTVGADRLKTYNYFNLLESDIIAPYSSLSRDNNNYRYTPEKGIYGVIIL